jgi:hypothetical protein
MVTSGWEIGSVELQFLLPILPMVSCFSEESERILLLAGYGTLWVSFGVLLSSFFWVVGCH